MWIPCVYTWFLTESISSGVSILTEATPAGPESCCCLTSHHEYSEAAVSEDSGGKNSKVIEANPHMKARAPSQCLRNPDCYTDCPFSDPWTTWEESPGELLWIGHLFHTPTCSHLSVWCVAISMLFLKDNRPFCSPLPQNASWPIVSIKDALLRPAMHALFSLPCSQDLHSKI